MSQNLKWQWKLDGESSLSNHDVSLEFQIFPVKITRNQPLCDSNLSVYIITSSDGRICLIVETLKKNLFWHR